MLSRPQIDKPRAVPEIDALGLQPGGVLPEGCIPGKVIECKQGPEAFVPAHHRHTQDAHALGIAQGHESLTLSAVRQGQGLQPGGQSFVARARAGIELLCPVIEKQGPGPFGKGVLDGELFLQHLIHPQHEVHPQGIVERERAQLRADAHETLVEEHADLDLARPDLVAELLVHGAAEHPVEAPHDQRQGNPHEGEHGNEQGPRKTYLDQRRHDHLSP